MNDTLWYGLLAWIALASVVGPLAARRLLGWYRLPRCPKCCGVHDPRPCARDSAICGCCSAIYADADERAAACGALDSAA